MTKVLTAAAAGLAPLAPPKTWFDDPKLSGPTALTVSADGRVHGHAALWDTCHRAYMPGQCVTPLRSKSGYGHFHLGAIETAEGDELAVGTLTMGCGHASTARGVTAERAMAHYDETGRVAAYVRAGEDEFGIWLAGAVRSDLPAAELVELRGNPISCDWRGGELIAMTCVPVPGFPVPRVEARLAASGVPLALVASTGAGIVIEKPAPRTKSPAKAAAAPMRRPVAKAKTARPRTTKLRRPGERTAPAPVPVGAVLRAVTVPAESVPADGRLHYMPFERPTEQPMVAASTFPVAKHR